MADRIGHHCLRVMDGLNDANQHNRLVTSPSSTQHKMATGVMLPSLIVILFTFISLTEAVWPFPTKRFAGNAFLEAGSLGLGDGRVAALGDFNGDQL